MSWSRYRKLLREDETSEPSSVDRQKEGRQVVRRGRANPLQCSGHGVFERSRAEHTVLPGEQRKTRRVGLDDARSPRVGSSD